MNIPIAWRRAPRPASKHDVHWPHTGCGRQSEGVGKSTSAPCPGWYRLKADLKLTRLGEAVQASVERKASHCTVQHSKRLEHAPDMVRQTRRHADELRPCTEQRTCPMGIERFHVHRPIPSRAHDLRQPLGIVPVGLVHLHLECGTGMSRIEADHVQPSLAQFMHKPRRHRAGFDPDAGIISRMPSHSPLNLLRICMTLASPESATRIVNHADRSQLLRNVQTNKSGHRAVSHVRTAGQQRPDHGTMERSGPQPRLPDVHIRAYNPIKDVSGASLLPFVQSAAVPGALIHTDGWGGYSGLTAAGYKHEVTVVSASPDPAHVVMPRVHNIAALL